MEEKLLRPEKAAEMLTVSNHFLRLDRSKNGEKRVPFIRMGRLVRYKVSDLLEIMQLESAEDRLLDTKDAAEMLGMSKAFLEQDRFYERGKVPFVRITKRLIRYRLSDIRKVQEKGTE